MSCPSCGYENPLGARFCSSCGTPLEERVPTHDVTAAYVPAIDDDESDHGEELPTGTTGVFVVRKGPKRGTRIALDNDEVSIGRHPDSDIFLDDVTVSRHHATVRRAGTTHEVTDGGSMNGTYINKQRLDSAVLRDGDVVQIGKFKLVYLAVGD